MFTDIIVVTKDKLFFSQLNSGSCNSNQFIQYKSIEEAITHCQGQQDGVLVIDIEVLEPQEMDYISYINKRFSNISIIIITPISMVSMANRAIESGASLYLTKPVSCESIKQTIDRILKNSQDISDRSNNEEKMLFELIGGSPAMEKIIKLIIKVAPSSANVLLGGENGTGKEYFGQIIHKLSKVKGDFVPLNCGAIPEQLFESELFGHAKGSFTGATKDKTGMVEEADGGTLFLDEVGELPLSSQVKLLRFLQERKFKRVGETRERSVNTRIIAATNRDLKEMVKDGKFREDLFYRLHVFPIILPPLRARKESIPNLITLFIHQANNRLNSNFTGFSTVAEFLLSNMTTLEILGS